MVLRASAADDLSSTTQPNERGSSLYPIHGHEVFHCTTSYQKTHKKNIIGDGRETVLVMKGK
jgi:hypothetical protein